MEAVRDPIFAFTAGGFDRIQLPAVSFKAAASEEERQLVGSDHLRRSFLVPCMRRNSVLNHQGRLRRWLKISAWESISE